MHRTGDLSNAAESQEVARYAARLIKLQIEEEEPILDIQTAIEKDSFLVLQGLSNRNPGRNPSSCPFYIEGEFETGGQEHWYLETQASLCIPGENREMLVHCSSQHPSETQAIGAEVLGIGRNMVTTEVKRMGGGFGGKETQANHIAALVAPLADASKMSGKDPPDP
ncbi:MAG: molybdopterin-dependent oxidoreductase [Bacteroidales bacterium]|nr:molybdopterin-dependent oxidoreductase [Bacteroidales bacterium]